MLVEEMKRFKELFFIPILFVCLCCQAKASAVLQDSIQLADSIKTVDSLSLVADTGLVPSIKCVPAEGEEKSCNASKPHFDRIIYTCAPLIINGLIMKGQSRQFRGLRNDYIPRFDRSLDNYTQYLPAAVMLGLKDLRSFPSGHTATAFMTATMLNKEYGYRSPWIGVGAYTVAAATGLMRMANNKHWLSDVLTGAGVGIVATELGYYFTDLIFKEHGLRKADVEEKFDKLQKPSYVGLNFLINEPLGTSLNEKGSKVKVSRGCTSAVEGAYFFNPYIGVGGRFSVTRTSVIVDNVKAEDNVFDTWKLGGGAYFSYPLSERWLLGSKLLVSSVFYPDIKLTDDLIDSHHGVGFGTGLSLTFRVRQHYNVRFLIDYNLLPYRVSGVRTCSHSLGLGSSFVISF